MFCWTSPMFAVIDTEAISASFKRTPLVLALVVPSSFPTLLSLVLEVFVLLPLLPLAPPEVVLFVVPLVLVVPLLVVSFVSSLHAAHAMALTNITQTLRVEFRRMTIRPC